jgi:WD40 repeat protein
MYLAEIFAIRFIIRDSICSTHKIRGRLQQPSYTMTGNESSSAAALPEMRALIDPPTDGITGLCYLGSKPLLASTSWDGSVRVHDTTGRGGAVMLSHMMHAGPLLSLAVQTIDAQYLYVGGMDGSVRSLDMETSKDTLLGRHESSNSHEKAACSCVASLGDYIVASSGWNKQLLLWDTRAPTSPVATVALPGKAFSMDVDPSTLGLVAVATSNRRFCFIDVRRNDQSIHAELVLDRESSLKYQTRCLRFFPDGGAIAVGSVEGRAGVEYLEELGREAKGKKYAFKCHRVGDLVYPVNAIEFHPIHGTFATGGCEGTVGTKACFVFGHCSVAMPILSDRLLFAPQSYGTV